MALLDSFIIHCIGFFFCLHVEFYIFPCWNVFSLFCSSSPILNQNHDFVFSNICLLVLLVWCHLQNMLTLSLSPSSCKSYKTSLGQEKPCGNSLVTSLQNDYYPLMNIVWLQFVIQLQINLCSLCLYCVQSEHITDNDLVIVV